ncbi:hypothetical protein [Nitrospirillum iridis]|uniref:Uncharacterized protein n=1 Tax=Nitrospirillum iridis TaxID=765888 RepID=A0A7X0EBR4_9PROT|nr:hypothetical protein [Nitrospirillum iridis]MBB6250858.1 hypothetical protein [Nitrospirillum iridis]
MFGNIFVKSKSKKDLHFFSKEVFIILGVISYKCRDSESYQGGRYVSGEALGLTIKISEADDPDFPDYDFHINFRPIFDWGKTDRNCLDGFADIVAKHLARHDMKIVRPLEFWKSGGGWVEYGDL